MHNTSEILRKNKRNNNSNNKLFFVQIAFMGG